MDTPHLQRLKRLAQLGITSFVWPSATHNRQMKQLWACCCTALKRSAQSSAEFARQASSAESFCKSDRFFETLGPPCGSADLSIRLALPTWLQSLPTTCTWSKAAARRSGLQMLPWWRLQVSRPLHCSQSILVLMCRLSCISWVQAPCAACRSLP